MNDRGLVTTDVTLPARYRVQRVLGIGGMATVYLADDLIGGRPVAVKVLKLALAGAVTTSRFLREIQLVRNLRHPNIVPLLDAGESEGVPYYVMPWVDGESLRRRLDRQRQLSLEDATRVARELAAALEAAHTEGVVHRDVKPENVLLAADRVFLADFGIARALSQAGGERLTDSGLAIGTPGYMSPEQAAGDRAVDARSDIYSLGCVLYEMLAGEAPYTGPSAQSVVAKQLSLPVPSLTIVRDTIPEEVDDVVRRALAKVPADRYETAGDFAKALGAASQARPTALTRLTRFGRRHARRLVGGAIFVVVAFGVGRIANQRAQSARQRLTPADTLRYAVLPFAHRGVSTVVTADAERSVREALLRWSGISVVDEDRVQDAVGTTTRGSYTTESARSLARALRSGRYFRGDVSGTDSHHELRLRLFDAFAGDSLLAEANVLLTESRGQSDSLVRPLVDSLLLREAALDAGGIQDSRSLPARQAYAIGRRAFDAWDLGRAASAFDVAIRMDASYTRAHLWLSLARLWRTEDSTRWRISAEQAALGARRLAERERVMARAVQAHSRGELHVACPLWRSLTAVDSLDAVAWYGSAYCLTSDDVVIHDSSSPSGWSFRTSYRRALDDYEHAFRLHPPMLASLGGEAFDALGRLFKTGTSLLRQGRAPPPSSQRFSSGMEWVHDSLGFVPYPLGRERPVHLFRRRDAMNEAVRHQRALVRGVASSWVAAFPQQADAWLALSMSLAALGQRSALDTLARARSLAQTNDERVRIAGAEVGLQLAFGVRDGNDASVRRARVLADSLLNGATDDTAHALLLSSLAALTGRASIAARYARSQSVAGALAVPDPLRDAAARLLVFSAIGGPPDSLRVLEPQVADLITRGISPLEQQGRRLEFLARAASMAFPLYRFNGLDALAQDGDALVILQSRLVHADSVHVRRGLAALGAEHRGILPEHLAIDALVPEAALLWSVGDASGVIQSLEPTLAVLPQMQPGLLTSPLRAASLTPAVLLRARAAAKLADRAEARRSASAVVILWSNADPFLQPLFEEAQRLTR